MPDAVRKGIWIQPRDQEMIEWWKTRYGLTSDAQAIRLALRLGRDLIRMGLDRRRKRAETVYRLDDGDSS